MQASQRNKERDPDLRGLETAVPRRHDKPVLLALFVLGCVYSSLLMLSDLLPFVDLPFHLGVATVVRGFGEAGNRFSDYFTLQIAGQPNVFHLWFCSRSIFPSVEFANKVYLALYTFLLPLSLYCVIRELRGNTWFSVLSCLYLYNFNTHWGFVGFIGAIPAVFFLFAVLVRHLQSPSRWTQFGVAIGTLLLFFIHVLAALFFLLVIGLTCLVDQWPNRKRLAKSFLLMVPAVVLIAWWWLGTEKSGDETLLDFMVNYYQNLFTQSFRIRSLFFSIDNTYLAGGRLGFIWGVLIAGMSVFFITWAALFEWSALTAALTNRRYRPVIGFVAAAGLCFFGLPEGLPRQWALNQRFSVYFILGVIVFSSVVELRILPRKLVISAILCSCLFHATLYADYFREFGIESEDFTDLALPEADEARLAGLILKPHYRGTLSYLHFPNYYIVRNQGIAVTRFVDFRFGIVRRKSEGSELPRAFKRFDKTPHYTGEYDEVDYLLVRGEIEPEMWQFLNNFEETDRNGDWSLLVHR